jgi:hypothetical protein
MSVTAKGVEGSEDEERGDFGARWGDFLIGDIFSLGFLAGDW